MNDNIPEKCPVKNSTPIMTYRQSGKERQANFRERRKEMGLVRFEVWVTPAQRDRLKALLAE